MLSRRIGWVVAIAASVVAVWAVGSAGGHPNSCHDDKSCPSDNHSYQWGGMSCASDPALRRPEDQTPVDHDGIRYWCHVVVDGGMGPPIGPPPPPPPAGATPPPPGGPPPPPPGGASGGGSSPSRCASVRAGVRTLSDRDAGRVRLAVISSTVEKLRRMRGPAKLGSRRATGAERRLYRVRARLVSARRTGTGAWQLTVADPRTDASMSVELPVGACMSATPKALRARVAAARKAFVGTCRLGARRGPVRLRGSATITGAGFFSTARARLALRPAVRFERASCRRR